MDISEAMEGIDAALVDAIDEIVAAQNILLQNPWDPIFRIIPEM